MIAHPIRGLLRKSSLLVYLYHKFKGLKGYLLFLRDFLAFRQRHDYRFVLRWRDRHPCLGDRTAATGFDAHYVYHTAWAARVLVKAPPAKHVDISSCLRFATIASAFVPITFYDWRPPRLYLTSLAVDQADLTSLPFSDGSIPSLSCMHVVEHVGLGRYGDALDPKGDLKAFSELARVLAPGGRLLLCLPMAEQPRLAFHAHRIYSLEQVLAAMPGLAVEQFDLIPDEGMTQGMIANATEQHLRGQKYACGCFVFTK